MMLFKARNFAPAFFGLFFAVSVNSQLVKISLTWASQDQLLVYQSLSDDVVLLNNDSFPIEIARIEALDKVEMSVFNGKVSLVRNGTALGNYRSVSFWANDDSPYFNLMHESGKNFRTYPDNLVVRVKASKLHVINEAYLENYIRGVVYAEAGKHQSLEFFKVQAVSARTYALNNRDKHLREGFELCDQTHCQAYNGSYKSEPLIDKAVENTISEVIVFDNERLIDAVFSANCGGHTANSEDVWTRKVSYLRGVPDHDYCEGFSNHSWHFSIGKDEFLSKAGHYHRVQAASFTIERDKSGRAKRIVLNQNPVLTISGEELRRLFGLKSSKFQVVDSGPGLVFDGAGYGHGVGMCQDGAYYLSRMGLDYDKIISHYYHDVEIGKFGARLNLVQND